jgi:nitrogen fixation NifU-like protein
MDLKELYQNVLLDHSKRPRNYGPLEPPMISVPGENPQCGDEVTLYVRLNPEGLVEDIHFTGSGCAISQASASLLTVKAKGKHREEILAWERVFHEMVAGKELPAFPQGFGDLRALEGVRKFPQRVKCATLAWNALRQALATPAQA